ncbi:MAG: SIMPL domain-containing protein [Pyrinomonadaceae bacterium]|nr:SIMPL domain-containing protein [Pyrinomonadaceae bacterium]
MLFPLIVCAASAQVVPDRPLITVTGQAEIKVIPDEVVVTLYVNTRDKVLANAKKQNDEKVKKTLALTRKYQITPENVQTASINISTEYSDKLDGDGDIASREFLGYLISQKISFALRDLPRLENLLSDLFEAGVNNIDDVDFRTTELRKFKDEARAMAIKAAQEKAFALTREIGQTIGKAYAIQEGEVTSAYANFSNAVGVSYNGNSGRRGNAQPTSTTPYIGETIAIGQISVTDTVTVSFELK